MPFIVFFKDLGRLSLLSESSVEVRDCQGTDGEIWGGLNLGEMEDWASDIGQSAQY